jgi:hypothetical protein
VQQDGYVTDLYVKVNVPPPDRKIYKILFGLITLPFLVTHLLGVGGPEETTKEAEKFSVVPGLIEDEDMTYGINEARKLLINAYNETQRLYGGTDFKWESCVDMKPRDKAVGEPLNRYGNYGKVLDTLGVPKLLEWLKACHEQVKTRVGHVSMFTVFSKVDKYKISKIEEGRFRTIQSSPLFLQMLMLRKLRGLENVLKQTVPEFAALGMTPADYHSVIGQFEERHTSIGYDVTGMDRSMPAQLIIQILSALEPLVGRQSMSYIIDSICYGPLVDTDGHVLFRSGGNPSGQNWTTVLNCLVNYAMNKAVERRIRHCCNFRVVGDDAIVWFSNPSVLPLYRKAMDEIAEQCNFTMKWQTVAAPPGEGTVFLDTVYKKWECADGTWTSFGCPARVERSTPKLFQEVDHPTEVARGILDRMSTLYYWNEDNGYEQPTSLTWIVERCGQLGQGLRNRETVEDMFILGREYDQVLDMESKYHEQAG